MDSTQNQSANLREINRLLDELKRSCEEEEMQQAAREQRASKPQATIPERKYYIVHNPFQRFGTDGKWHPDLPRLHKLDGWSSMAVKNIPLDLYVYEEAGVFYDFFGGTPLGTAESFKSKLCVMRNGYPIFALISVFPHTLPVARQVSPSGFAASAKKHSRYQEAIALYVKKALSHMDADKARESALRETLAAKAKQSQAQMESDTQAWLDRMISRHK